MFSSETRRDLAIIISATYKYVRKNFSKEMIGAGLTASKDVIACAAAFIVAGHSWDDWEQDKVTDVKLVTKMQGLVEKANISINYFIDLVEEKHDAKVINAK